MYQSNRGCARARLPIQLQLAQASCRDRTGGFPAPPTPAPLRFQVKGHCVLPERDTVSWVPLQSAELVQTLLDLKQVTPTSPDPTYMRHWHHHTGKGGALQRATFPPRPAGTGVAERPRPSPPVSLPWGPASLEPSAFRAPPLGSLLAPASLLGCRHKAVQTGRNRQLLSLSCGGWNPKWMCGSGGSLALLGLSLAGRQHWHLHTTFSACVSVSKCPLFERTQSPSIRAHPNELILP